MTINSRISAVLEPFGFDISFGAYRGKAETYFTFNWRSIGVNHADNVPHEERYLIIISLYSPVEKNTISLIGEVKKALDAAGFGWPEVHTDCDDSKRRSVFECEWMEGVHGNP